MRQADWFLFGALAAPVACGARSALDADIGAGGTGGVSATLAVGATGPASTSGVGAGAGSSCPTLELGVDGAGGVRLEAIGARLFYTTASGLLVRVDLPPAGATSKPDELVLARDVEPGGDIALFDGRVYFVHAGASGPEVRFVPVDGGAEESVFVPRGVPPTMERDASGLYVRDDVGAFSGRLVRVDSSGKVAVLVDAILGGIAFGIDDERVVGLGTTDFGGVANDVYAVAKIGGPVTAFGGAHFGVDYARMIDGALHWFEPSSAVPGTGELYRADGNTVTRVATLPEIPITFDADAARIYATAIVDVAANTHAVYALDRASLSVTSIPESGPERFPTEVRVAADRVAWTVQRNSGFDVDVPSVRVECATSFR